MIYDFKLGNLNYCYHTSQHRKCLFELWINHKQFVLSGYMMHTVETQQAACAQNFSAAVYEETESEPLNKRFNKAEN